MRILFCNKYSYPFSGTEVYLFDLMSLLRSQGHETALFSMTDPRGEPTPYDHHFVPHIDFKEQSGILARISGAAHAIYSSDARKRVRAMIKDFRPDIAHVRNIYHHLSPSILWELKAQNVPVIYHLNDFKLLCPSYNLVSHGEACEKCKGGKFWHLLEDKCYPGIGARLTLSAEAYVHKWLGTYRKCVDRFLAPSQFVRDKFVEHGWDATKFEVLPHFQRPHPLTKLSAPKGAPLLYFGRLSREKGVDDLIHAMQQVPHMNLVIAGDGPERTGLQDLAGSLHLNNIEFVGHVRGAELDSLIARSQFTVLPTHAYETLGKTILESYAESRAVVASDMGSRRELVHDGETGLLYPTGDIDQLADAIGWLGSRPEVAEKMGRTGREWIEQNHAPQAHYEAVLDLYERTVTAKATAPALGVIHKLRTPPWPKLDLHRNHSLRPVPLPVRKPKLRVAFIGGRGVVSKYSGIESYYEEVGKRLVEMGHEVTVYCRTYFTPPLAEHNGMRVVRLPSIRSKHLETLVHTFLSTAHVLTQRCDVVHFHALGPALFAFLPRLFGKKTVVTVQGLDWQRKKWGRVASSALWLGEQASVHLPNGTMVVSQALQQHYRERHGMEAFYVPNGGMLREKRKPEKIFDWDLEPGKYILFLGRFSPEKGCHLLVEAYEQLDTEVKLVMAGASSYCDDYSRNLRVHAGDRIKILDWVSGAELDELLTNAMLFVLPSQLEGLSLALLDAMGAGLCVLASDVAENREVVQETGFTFESGNANDLAEQLRLLIANPALRRATGEMAQMKIRRQYQWSQIALEIEKAYFKIMGQDQPTVETKKPSGRVSEPASGRRTG